jgi:hypothetical protein
MSERWIQVPEEVVDLTSAGWNSRKGRYFIGQTGELFLSNQVSAWSGIINPWESGVNLYFDIFTITNFGENYYTAEIWLNAEPPISAEYATVIPSNQAISPQPVPNAYMLQADNLVGGFKNGVNIFDRIVPPNSTLVSDSHQGSIIIGQGGTFSILLKVAEGNRNKAAIVLTWWEERIGGINR